MNPENIHPENLQPPKMSAFAFGFFLVIALIFDALGLIPGLNTILATLMWGSVAFYFKAKGIPLFDAKKIATIAASWIVSLFPAFPLELTAGIIAIFFFQKIERRLKTAVANKVPKIVRPMIRKPLYKDGVRQPEA